MKKTTESIGYWFVFDGMFTGKGGGGSTRLAFNEGGLHFCVFWVSIETMTYKIRGWVDDR